MATGRGAWGVGPGVDASPAPHVPRPLLRDLLFVTAVALITNCLFLDAKGIWLDEAVSIDFASLGPRLTMTRMLAYDDPNMRLYYTLLSVWMKFSGTSETAMRLPSAICTALTAPLVYLLGVRFYGRWAGLIAATLFALNAFSVEYGQTIRAYALLTLLVTAATCLFVLELDRPARLTRIAYVITGALAFYAHFFAALSLLGHFAALILIRGKSAFTKETAFVAGGLLLLCSPVMWFVASNGGGGIDWIDPLTLGAIGNTAFRFAGKSGLLLALLLGAAAYESVAARRSGETTAVAILAAWCLVPFMAAAAVSLAKPVFRTQYLIASLPPLLLLAAGGLTKFRARIVVVTGATVALVLSASALVSYYGEEGRYGYREAAAWVAPQLQAGDGIIFMPFYLDMPYEYYQRRGAPPYPEKLSSSAVSGRERVWLVYSYGHIGGRQREFEDARASLSKTHRLKATQSLQRVEIEYYVK